MDDDSIFTHLNSEDLLQFGIIPELIGRISVIAPMLSLSEKNMAQILTDPKNSIVKQYQSLMDMDGIKLNFQKEAVKTIAKIASSRKIGARALRSIVEELMMTYMFNYPGSNKKTLTISSKDIEKYIDIHLPNSERKKLQLTIDK